eukprot:TRINITY_DN6260_c0_g1_i1.p1 TRINITY_DN6260_c0_g1~~TRINITY_DN6260_c0_g1_i1.p1  ORF type:complete len:337 (+),score=95.84 TRINITY_DN6260_c0_g1_i1:70-1080(+)
MSEGEVLQQKINALSNINLEIINRIEKLITTQTNLQYPTYHFRWDPHLQSIKVECIQHAVPVLRIVQHWKPTTPRPFQITEEMNFFNDNIDYTCRSFEDLKRLNNKFSTVSKKFSWLDSNKSPPILRNFLENIEILQLLLGEVDELTLEKGMDVDPYGESVKRINEEIGGMIKDIHLRNLETGKWVPSVIHSHSWIQFMGDLSFSSKLATKVGSKGWNSVIISPLKKLSTQINLKIVKINSDHSGVIIGITDTGQITSSGYDGGVGFSCGGLSEGLSISCCNIKDGSKITITTNIFANTIEISGDITGTGTAQFSLFQSPCLFVKMYYPGDSIELL